MKYLGLTMTELHELYVAGKATPLDVINEVIAALEKDQNNILEKTMYEKARAAAASLTKVEEDNVLWGIPFLVKDNLTTKGVETTGSSNILNGFVPLCNAEVIEKLVAAKAIPVAKTTLDEFGMGGRGETGHKGTTYNPYGKERTRIVGGSSSGSASGVASGYVPFAVGSDTGDSIRKPASFAGLVGFKPTWGAISRFGLYAFMPTLDHVGFFTRSVGEARVLFEKTSGYDKKDATSMARTLQKEAGMATLKGKRIAVLEPLFALMKNKLLINEFNTLVEQLRQEGAVVDFVPFDKDILAAIFPTYFILSCAEASISTANLTGIGFGNKKDGESYEEIVANTRGQGFSSRIKHRLMLGQYALKKENRQKYYDRAQKARRLIVEAVDQVLASYDVIMLPAAPNHAPTVNKPSEPNSEIENNYMAIANFGGNPSLTLPFCLDEGLPIGINLTGKQFDDFNVLNIALKIEEITKLYNLHAGLKL
ncbi:MAG: Glutamyl-tRNA(Gln) amidotransferase subunit A [Tenericutes bacterium ADurb.Bin087]|nr:MAG: Glutamyl-tRNA(Gln) amidotransferase subunit A [Tenericutes bacterium ADurb.Bin087]